MPCILPDHLYTIYRLKTFRQHSSALIIILNSYYLSGINFSMIYRII